MNFEYFVVQPTRATFPALRALLFFVVNPPRAIPPRHTPQKNSPSVIYRVLPWLTPDGERVRSAAVLLGGLKRWPYRPGDEFVVADAKFLTGGRHAAGDLKREFEELIPDALQILAFNDRSGI